MEINSIVTLGGIVIAVLTILGYFKSKEKETIAAITDQRTADEKQNQKIALLEQEVTNLKANAKEIKGEVIDKIEHIDSKVDDLKRMLIEFFTKIK